MRRNTLGLVWMLGILATAAVYAAGPDRVVANVGFALAHFGDALDTLAAQLVYGAFDMMRALALGLFGVFVALCLLANRRGIRSTRTLVVVGVLFLGLVGAFGIGEDVSVSRHWLGAFVLAAVAAAVMTRRLATMTAVARVDAGWAGTR